MTTLSEIEIRQIKDATIREVIRKLTKGARDPERIGRRVLMWQFTLNPVGKKLSLAKQLGVAEATVSIALTDAHAALSELRKATSASQPADDV